VAGRDDDLSQHPIGNGCHQQDDAIEC
jgi:hypothetical protein